VSLCDPRWFKGKCIFRRVDASSEFGVKLVGQREAFHIRPEGRWISRRSIEGLGLQVPSGTTLIPSHGTLGERELYCRALIATRRTSEYAFSGDFFRCIPLRERVPAGYLFAFLRSQLAFRLLRTISIGGKQQEQHPAMMWRFPIPRLDKQSEALISEMVENACSNPPSVPVSLIELSSQIILHKFNSPAWLKHIQKANAALAALTPEKMAHLSAGEAYVWSSRATDEAFSKGAVHMHCRPRVTCHGGTTRTAVGYE
jgi:hypothetical protein